MLRHQRNRNVSQHQHLNPIMQDTTLVIEELFKSKRWLQDHQFLRGKQFRRQSIVEIADLLQLLQVQGISTVQLFQL